MGVEVHWDLIGIWDLAIGIYVESFPTLARKQTGAFTMGRMVSVVHTELSMALRRSALLGPLLLVFIAGCQPAPKPVAAPLPPPATDEQASNVQAEIQEQDPNARTGLVTLVRPQDELAAVTLSAPAEGKADNKIKVGDTFTFIDSEQNSLANGTVVSIDGDLVVISYLPSADGRAPKEGDIAVHLSMK
jgi:hypothetical protein